MHDPHELARPRPRQQLLVTDPHDPIRYMDDSGLIVTVVALAAVFGFVVGVLVGWLVL